MTYNKKLNRSWKYAGMMILGASLCSLLPVRQAGAISPQWLRQVEIIGRAHENVLDLSYLEQVALLERVMSAYRNSDLPGGDNLRKNLRYPEGQVLAEWYAIRRGLPMGYRRIKAFFDENPTWPKSDLIKRRIENAFLDSSASDRNLIVFFKANTPLTNRGRLSYFKALKAQGYAQESADLLRQVWRSGKLDTSTESYILSQKPSVLDKRDHKERFERLLFESAWREAASVGNYLGMGYDKIVDARRMIIEGETGADSALALVPENLRKEPANIFSLVRFLRSNKKYKDAAIALAHLKKEDAPSLVIDGDRWWDERERLARALLDQREFNLAYQVASLHEAESPSERLDGEFLSGWIALRFLKKPELAARHFAKAATIGVTPISASRAQYWQGRAAEAKGNAKEAHYFYEEASKIPVAYYGQLARKKLNLPVGQVRALPYVLSYQDIQRVASMPSYKALKAAEAIGNRALAMLLGADIAASMNNLPDMDAFATLAFENNNPRLAMAIGKAAYQKGLPLDYHSYPLGGVPEFQQKGIEIDEALVYAIARQESAFDHTARSSAGARGLMQLMPGTAKETAGRLKLAYDVERLTEDPGYNATLGSAYLGALIRQWNGCHELAFASYNAGAGNVKKWMTAYGDPRKSENELIDWIERVPFPETRNYIQRVAENYHVYQFLIKNPQKMEMPASAPASVDNLQLRTGDIR